MLYQNQIIILRRGKKCVAFKPVEVITRDRSWEEAPKGCQYTGTTATTFDKNGKTIKIKIEKEHASPIWKSIIYEWKILSPDSHKEILSATNYEASQGSSSAPFAVKELIKGKGWMVILGDYERPFYIPGVDSAVKFSFSKDLKENEKEIQERIKNVELSEYFWEINYEISVCLVNKAGIASTEDGIEKIKDPSLYNFHKFGRMMRFWPIFTESSDTYTILEPDDCLRMTTIFKLDNRYVAIRLLKIENGQVFYQWKYWPLILSETEITDQKQAKQQADEEEANQKSGVKKSRMMAEKSSYLAGMSFSWEVPQKPEQESVVLSYEVKLKSIERVEFALVKEGEIRDIKYSSLSQYGFTIPAEDHGKTEVKLNTVVIFKINDKCVILKPKKIENSSLGNAVIYDWKILGEKR